MKLLVLLIMPYHIAHKFHMTHDYPINKKVQYILTCPSISHHIPKLLTNYSPFFSFAIPCVFPFLTVPCSWILIQFLTFIELSYAFLPFSISNANISAFPGSSFLIFSLFLKHFFFSVMV